LHVTIGIIHVKSRRSYAERQWFNGGGYLPEGSKGDRFKNIRKPKKQMPPVVRVKPVVI